MLLDPVKQGQLILCQLGQNGGLVVACAKLCLHILYHIGDTRIIRMFVISLKKVKLRVLLDLHAQVIKLLDRRVAGKEVKRSGTEGYNL